MHFRFRPEDVRPLPEEYTRVTNPQRFEPLVAHTRELLARLRDTYDVVERAVFEDVPGLARPLSHARPPVTLTPVSPAASPLGVAFTDFPGIVVRYGRWHAEPFPSCGCDACAETADDQAARLDELVRFVTGTFEEEVRIPLFGEARLFVRSGEAVDRPTRESWHVIPRQLAKTLRAGRPRRILWQPWEKRRIRLPPD